MNVFLNFVIISRCKKVWPFHLNKLKCFTTGCILPSLVEIGPVVLLKKIFIFLPFCNNLPLEGPFIWINFTHGCFVLSMVEFSKLVLERKIFKFVNVFSLFHNYLPLKKGGALHLNKVDSPSAKDQFCQVWLKLVQWFWRRLF